MEDAPRKKHKLATMAHIDKLEAHSKREVEDVEANGTEHEVHEGGAKKNGAKLDMNLLDTPGYREKMEELLKANPLPKSSAPSVKTIFVSKYASLKNHWLVCSYLGNNGVVIPAHRPKKVSVEEHERAMQEMAEKLTEEEIETYRDAYLQSVAQHDELKKEFDEANEKYMADFPEIIQYRKLLTQEKRRSTNEKKKNEKQQLAIVAETGKDRDSTISYFYSMFDLDDEISRKMEETKADVRKIIRKNMHAFVKSRGADADLLLGNENTEEQAEEQAEE